MHRVLLALVLTAGLGGALPAPAADAIRLGSRPSYLAGQLRDPALATRLQRCLADDRPVRSAAFSIAHRGASLHYPEHTREAYLAAIEQGAGVVECDVTFTRDRQLVCRHAQCDLHTTTDILLTPLAGNCTVPPRFDADGALANAAELRCCTSDLTLAQFRTLSGRMDRSDPQARSISGFLGLDRSAGRVRPAAGTLMTHAEAIELLQAHGVNMTPELKAPEVPMPFQGDFDLEAYAARMLADYVDAGVPASRVYPQSFDLAVVRFWLERFPAFAPRVVYLDGREGLDANDAEALAALEPSFEALAATGLRLIAPPLSRLLTVDDGRIAPSLWARRARAAGLEVIAWTLERSGPLRRGGGGGYYAPIADALRNDGDVYVVLDVLARQIGVVGVFSDWPATTTAWAHCMDVRTFGDAIPD